MINISAKDVNFYYGSFHALKNITLGIERNTVTAFIGPSGCGKSTFLRLLNRMNDLIEGTRLNRRRGHLRPGRRGRRAAQKGRHGFPETESVSEDDL